MAPAAKAPDESNYSGRFAARLRSLREKAGLSVQDAVAALNSEGKFAFKDATYYSWESGRTTPPLKAFPPLAKVLGLGSPRTLLPSE